jgi:hypothetical protein
MALVLGESGERTFDLASSFHKLAGFSQCFALEIENFLPICRRSRF